MGFRRTRVEDLERCEAIDINRTNNSAWNNLVLLAKNFVRPGNGIVWGCDLTAPGGMFVDMAAGAVMCEGGPVVFDASQTLVIATSHPTLDRIDLISVGFPDPEPTGTNEARTKWDDNLQQAFSTPIDTEVISDTTATVTTGTPSATPVAPATPSGHVAIAEVYVTAGTVTIASGDITELAASVLPGVKFKHFNLVSVNAAMPYDTNTNLMEFVLKLDSGRLGFILAKIDVASQSSTNSPAAVQLELRSVSPSAQVGKAHYPFVTKASPSNTGGTSLWVMGAVIGTGSAVTYFLRLNDLGGYLMPPTGQFATTPNIHISDVWFVAVSM